MEAVASRRACFAACLRSCFSLATGLKGKTPGQVFYSTLYSESKKPQGLVVQTDRGEFKLNPKRRRP